MNVLGQPPVLLSSYVYHCIAAILRKPAKPTLQAHAELRLARRRFQKQVQLRHSGSCAAYRRPGRSWIEKLPLLLDVKQR